MHKYQSTSSVRRLRLAALLMCVRCLVSVFSLVLLIDSLVLCDLDLALIGVGLIGVTLVIAGLQWIAAAESHCPLCRMTVLMNNKCAKHRRVRRILGSYRLPVALSILFRKSFVCPYCHEQSTLAVHKHKRETRSMVAGRFK